MWIWIGLTLCSAAAAVCFALLFFNLRSGVKDAAEQMKIINKTEDTNQKLLCAGGAGRLEQLLVEVNLELAKRQSDRAGYADKEKELRRQIANVSHDLRTPLTSILGYVELLKDDSLPAAERDEYLTIVERRGKALQELIGGFYDLSRLESGEYPLQSAPVNLHHVLCSLLAMFYQDFGQRGFEMEVELDEEAPAVPGDEAAVVRIFTNLLQNVLAHGMGRAAVRMWVEEEADIDCGGCGDGSGGCGGDGSSGCGGRAVVTEISNATEEMTEEVLPHVFDRFFTADEMRTGQNTGLGLTIAKQFVEQLGHEIHASLRSEGGQKIFSVKIYWFF